MKVVPDEEQLIISKALENYIYELEKEVQELKRESFRCLICEKNELNRRKLKSNT